MEQAPLSDKQALRQQLLAQRLALPNRLAASEQLQRVMRLWLLRRSGWESTRNILNITDEFRLDFNRYEAWIKGQRVDLTITEFKILQLLTRHPGWVYKRSQILDHLWGNDKVVIERTVDVHIRNLREKLGEFSYMLQNVRGLGYKFDAASKESKREKNKP